MEMNINSVTKNVVSNSYKFSEKLKNNSKIASEKKEENTIEDIVTISVEASQKLEKEMSAEVEERVQSPTNDAISDKAAEYSHLDEDLANARKSAEGMAESFEAMRLAMQIAARMSKGAKVSPKDEEFLMSFNHKMYMTAKSAQGIAQHQEDLSDETLSEDQEKSDDDTEALASGGEAMPVETAQVSENSSADSAPAESANA